MVKGGRGVEERCGGRVEEWIDTCSTSEGVTGVGSGERGEAGESKKVSKVIKTGDKEGKMLCV